MQPTGVVEERQGRPLFGLPDLLTVLRVPLAVMLLILQGAAVRLVIVVLAAVSDLVDGAWARRVGGSRAGVVLDPICDKVFILSAFLVLWRGKVLLPIELLGFLLRDVIAVLAFLTMWMLRRATTLPARAGGKAVTVCQVLTLVAFLADSELVRPLAWATAAISVYAIADYSHVAWSR